MPRIRQQILRVLSADAAKIARENSQNRKTNSSKSLLWRTPTELKDKKFSAKPVQWVGVEYNSNIWGYVKISMVHMQRKQCTVTKVTG